MKKVLLFFLHLSLLTEGDICAQQHRATEAALSSSAVIFEGHTPQPRPQVRSVDPAFQNSFTRITDARNEKMPGFFPQYSKRQAWNADESGLLVFSDDGNVRLYDGQTYRFQKILEGVGGEDVFWHPTLPSALFFTEENNICRYDIGTGVRSVIKSFPEYSFVNTRGEGNLSADGSYYAFVGQVYDEGAQTVLYKKIVLVNLVRKKIVAELALPAGLENFDWVSVSPGGDYIVVDYADNATGPFHGVEVYDTAFHRIWQKPLGAGHSDLGFDAKGDEVLIMDYYDESLNKTVIKKWKLKNGEVTDLLELSPLFDLHISCRNEQNRDWCFISTFGYVGRLNPDSSNWLPFENEIFALRTDGSGEVRRLFHHHSRRYTPSTPDSDNSNYWAEPHATVNRKGNRIAWGSNWGNDVKEINSVDVYIGNVDLQVPLRK